MSRWLMIVSVVTVVSLASASARQLVQTRPNDPGMPTVARTYILNSGAAEAVPVVVQPGGDVQPVVVQAMPAVTLAPATVVTTRPARVSWEYRQIVLAASDDASTALNEAGAQGWEAVGLASRAGGTLVLLKRER